MENTYQYCLKRGQGFGSIVIYLKAIVFYFKGQLMPVFWQASTSISVCGSCTQFIGMQLRNA